MDKKKMRIKGYTTEIAPEQTIMEIEKILSDFGADAIMKEYTKVGHHGSCRSSCKVMDISYRQTLIRSRNG